MITWNTEVNAPCCPGEIVNDDGRTVLVQTDYDYPGVAGSFGWSPRSVQKCNHMEEDADGNPHGFAVADCPHHGTDGTVDCPDCGVTAGQFIASAREWLDDHDGATADDPGYFE